MRFSTIPFAFGSVIFCYLLVRRAGLRAKEALFVTALFELCPLFLPVAVSYMTDVPCLFLLFASLYALTRAAEASLEGRGYGWLALGVILGFLGGTGRQVAWLAPLVVLPYRTWLRRTQRLLAWVTLGAWVTVFGGVGWVILWFNRQPYIVEQLSLMHELKIAMQKPKWEIEITAGANQACTSKLWRIFIISGGRPIARLATFGCCIALLVDVYAAFGQHSTIPKDALKVRIDTSKKQFHVGDPLQFSIVITRLSKLGFRFVKEKRPSIW